MGEKLPLLSQIEGGTKVTAIRSGNLMKVSQGDLLHYGDRIRTDSSTSLKVSYPDGSRLFLGQDSELIIERKGQVPSPRLITGDVRALVKKEVQKSKLKFFIRSSNATMGVRGTDFVVSTFKSKTSLHVLEGEVLVAKNEKDLHSENQIRQVTQNLEVTFDGEGDTLPETKSFDRERFLKEFNHSHPTLKTLWEQAEGGKNKPDSPKMKQKKKKKKGPEIPI